MPGSVPHAAVRAAACSLLIAGSVLLASCGRDEAPAAGPSPTAGTPSGTPTSAAPSAAPTTSEPPATAEPAPAVATTVTTPNGLHSFSVPAGWTAVEAEPRPVPAHAVGYVTPAAFTILNEAGRPVASFYSGIPGDGAGVPSPGHVLYDAEPLPGYLDGFGRQVYFQFESRPDWETGGRGYHVQLEPGPLPQVTGDDRGPDYGTFHSADGGVSFTAVPDPAAVADDASAEAWMGSDEYRLLKDMMLSLQFHG